MELLIKASYEDDPRIKKGFHWLLSLRQEDGGWVIPFRSSGMNIKEALLASDPEMPDRSRPFSHLVTGMAPRALAAHPEYRKSEETKKVAYLLVSRLFQADKYPDRKGKYWERFLIHFGSQILSAPWIHYHSLE